MAQIQTGTAAVTNGSSLVTASAGNDWSAADVGHLFTVNGTGVLYQIAAIRAPGSNVSGRWEIDLSANYASTTNPAAAYAIAVDFTPRRSLAIINPGDTATAAIFSRNMAQIETELDSLEVLGSAPWSADLAYNVGELVRGSDGNVYRVRSANLGADPTTHTAEWRIQWVGSDVTLAIPSRFADFASAWEFVKQAAIAPDATVTIQFADGTYVMHTGAPNGLYNLTHPHGAQIAILGHVGVSPGPCVLDWSASSYDWGALSLTWATDHMGAFYVNAGHVMPYLDGFKIIGPGRAKQYYALQAFNGGTIRTGPNMWVTDFYSALAVYFGSSAHCDYLRASNGGDGCIFAYGNSAISFRGGIAEGADSLFAKAGACIEFGSSLFAPGATFRNNTGAQIMADYGSSLVLDGSTFQSPGAFDSAPAVKCGGGVIYTQRNGAETYTNCSGDNFQLHVDPTLQQVLTGSLDAYRSFYGNFSHAASTATVSLSVTKQGVASMFMGFAGDNKLVIGNDGPEILIKTASSNALGGDQIATFRLSGVILRAPATQRADADIPNGGVHFYLDESGNNLKFRARYSGGTLKTGTVALT